MEGFIKRGKLGRSGRIILAGGTEQKAREMRRGGVESIGK